MFVIAASIAASINLRYIRDGAEDYPARILTSPGSLMKTHPVVSQKGRIAFTMLKSPVYTIGVSSGDTFTTVAADTDVFRLAFIPGSSYALVELAGPVSRIVRIDLDAAPIASEKSPVEVENGQQPVVSPDGRWLAFIREIHGRGGLWLKRLDPDSGREAAGWSEHELVGLEYDVLEANFDAESREIIFAAQPHGGPALFKLGLTSSRITEAGFEFEARYPAFSHDGEWLAYSRLQGGSWQIWLKSLRSGFERRMTAWTCNSISPAWTPDSKELIYATDCGRGLGMTALARVRITP